jgi:hypothetical protein
VYPVWSAVIPDKVNGGVIAPDHRVGIISEIPGESQDVSIEKPLPPSRQAHAVPAHLDRRSFSLVLSALFTIID